MQILSNYIIHSHSTVVLLKPDLTLDNYTTTFYLHSTVVLLKHERWMKQFNIDKYLHSTVVLLKR